MQLKSKSTVAKVKAKTIFATYVRTPCRTSMTKITPQLGSNNASINTFVYEYVTVQSLQCSHEARVDQPQNVSHLQDGSIHTRKQRQILQ